MANENREKRNRSKEWMDLTENNTDRELLMLQASQRDKGEGE